MRVGEDALQEVIEDLVDLLENGEDSDACFAAALQLFAMGEARRTVGGLARMLDGPGRLRAARQLGRLGPMARPAWPALVRAVADAEEEELCLAAVEALVAIDPENLFGAVQLIRMLQVVRRQRSSASVAMHARALRAVRRVGRLLPERRRASRIFW